MDNLAAASLRRLRAFLVVCETMHVGQAAERLGIAQPALSQQIRGLETGLGVRLFHRRKRAIDLTAAGKVYRAEAAKLLRLHAEAAEEARGVAQGELGTLAVGYVASAMFEDCFLVTLSAMHVALPDLRIALREDGITELMRGLVDGGFDLVLLRAPIPLPPGCWHMVCARQRLAAVLPASHRLAGRPRVSMSDLAGEPMVGFNDREDRGTMRIAAELAALSGYELRVEWRVSAITGVLGLVAAGQGFGIVPESTGRLALPGVCFRSLDDEGAMAELWYVWRADRVSPALGHMLATVRDQGAGRSPPHG